MVQTVVDASMENGNGLEEVKKIAPKAPPKPNKKPERKFTSQEEPLPGDRVNGGGGDDGGVNGIYSTASLLRNGGGDGGSGSGGSERSAFVSNNYYDLKSTRDSSGDDGLNSGSRMSTLRVSTPLYGELPATFQYAGGGGTLQRERPSSRNSVMTNTTSTTLAHPHTPIRSSVGGGADSRNNLHHLHYNNLHHLSHHVQGGGGGRFGGNSIYDSVHDHNDEAENRNVFSVGGSRLRASIRDGVGGNHSIYYNTHTRNMNAPTNLVRSGGDESEVGNGGMDYSVASAAASSAAAAALNSNGLRKGGSNTNVSKSNPKLNGNDKQRGEYQRLQRVDVKAKKLRTDSYKVIAFICGFFAAILLVMGLASSEWLITSGYRQGLFVYCVADKNETVPFVSNTEKVVEGCHRIDLQYQAYTLVAAAFCVVSLLVDVFATLLTALGLRCRDPNKKYKYYRIAVYVMALALVTVLVALVIYPVCFAQIMEESKRPFWEFGWAYGVGWGASIFLFGGVILLLCDKESEEIYYKERTIVQYADTNSKA